MQATMGAYASFCNKFAFIFLLFETNRRAGGKRPLVFGLLLAQTLLCPRLGDCLDLRGTKSCQDELEARRVDVVRACDRDDVLNDAAQLHWPAFFQVDLWECCVR